LHNYVIVFLKDYVDEIYDTIVDAILGKKLEKEIKELKD
jgi:NAD(P)H-hydrate repair Nnr-like enzyme with NAD(P)H-hydrate epimerase domain